VCLRGDLDVEATPSILAVDKNVTEVAYPVISRTTGLTVMSSK
jgi:hypothetical protein